MSSEASTYLGVACQSVLNGEVPLIWTNPCVDPFTHTVNAPIFLWFGCLVVIVSTLIFVVTLSKSVDRFVRTLNRLTRGINSIEPRNGALDGPGLDKLRELMRKTSLVSDAWDEFEETLLVTNDGNRQQIFNTRQAEEYFSVESIIAGRINLRFYAAFPGILTSVGLLLTFVAILIGLSHIHPDATSQHKLTGVEDLVYSLSGKFISSITALICAVLFTFVEKAREASIQRAIYDFIRSLNRRLSRKSAEHILQLIQRDIGEQSIAFRQFSTDLSGRLKEGLSEGMGPHFQKVAEAVDELRKHKSESMTDSLQQLISEFKGALMGATNSEFKSLETTLAKTAEIMSSMNEQSKVTQARMAEVIENLNAASSRQSLSGAEQMTRLTTTMQVIIDKLEASAAQSSGSMTNTVSSVIEQLKGSFAAQGAEMNQRNSELAELTKQMLDQVRAGLSQSSSTVSSTVDGVLSKSAEWTERTASQLGAVLSEQSKSAQSFHEARESLNSALEVFRRAIQEGASTLKEMGTTSTIVRDGAVTLSGAVDNLGRSQDKVIDLSALVERNANNLKFVIDRQAEIVTKYEAVVKDLDRSLANVLTQVTAGIENYSAKVKSSLENTLGQFDNHLSVATNKLGGTVDELSESLEEIVELASKSRESNA